MNDVKPSSPSSQAHAKLLERFSGKPDDKLGYLGLAVLGVAGFPKEIVY